MSLGSMFKTYLAAALALAAIVMVAVAMSGKPKPPPKAFAEYAPPTLDVTALDGTRYTSDTLAGKVVLLDFWASWCGPCRMSGPAIERLHKKFASKGVVVLGLNVAEPRSKIESYLANEPKSYPIAPVSDSTANQWGASGLPTFVFIGKEGKVASRVSGYGPEFEAMASQKLDELLAR